MANIPSIQDIEAVDDNWGPTFRSILDSDANDILSDQIEARIRSHDKDIERICNPYYQGSIDSIRELLHVRTQANNLNEEVLQLDDTLGMALSGVLAKGKDLDCKYD